MDLPETVGYIKDKEW